MSTYDYSTIQTTAQTLIDKYGKAFTLSKTTGGSFVPATNSYSGGSTSTYAVNGVLSDYNKNLIDGSSIRFGDKKLIVAAKDLAVTPEANDIIIDSSDNWTIVSVAEVKPASTKLIYELQLRR